MTNFLRSAPHAIRPRLLRGWRAAGTVLLLAVLAFAQLLPRANALDPQQYILWQRNIGYFNVTYCGDGSPSTSEAQVGLVGSDNGQKIFNFFTQHGLTPTQAAGIFGNLMQESSIDPTNSDGGAFGLAQWQGDRLTNLKNFATSPGQDGNYQSLATQLNFLWYEVTQGTEKNDGALDALKATNDAATAATVWEQKFERASDPVMENRIKYAQEALAQYGGSAATATALGGSSVTCTSNTSAQCNNPAAAPAGLSALRQKVACIALQEVAKWTPPTYNDSNFTNYAFRSTQQFPKYNVIGSDYSQGRLEEWCADFVTWVFNQAGYPLQSPNWNVAYVPTLVDIAKQNKNFHWHPVGSGYTPRPGDIAIHNGQNHVNVVVAMNGSAPLMVGGDQTNPALSGSTNYGGDRNHTYIGPPSTSVLSEDSYVADMGSGDGFISPD